MKFRTSLLALVVALIAATVVATIGVVATVLQSSARTDIREALSRSRAVFDEQKTLRESLHRSEGRVVAEEPRLKAVVATEEVNHETVISVAVELRKALQSDLFVITDGEAGLLADTADPSASGGSMKAHPLVAGALDTGEKTGIVTQGKNAYEADALRLEFGATPVGVLLIGYQIDDRIADAVARQTGSEVVIELDGQPIAVSPELRAADRGELAKALEPVALDVAEPADIVAGDTHYLAIAGDFNGSSGPKLRYVVLRSLDRALAPARSVTRVLYLVGAVALALALLLAVLLSQRLSRPLEGLMGFVQKIGSGSLEARAEPGGPVEIRALGDAMNRMVKELDVSRKELLAKDRLERELEISARIQTSILPSNVAIRGLEVATAMQPATEVGGDYYDLYPVPGGGWIGIGDVAGHGLTSGLIMLMVQAGIATLGRDRPDATPKQIVTALNKVLYDNIRHRLRNDEHVTLSVLRYFEDGRVLFAGAHEEMIHFRKQMAKCELIPTPGTWLGAVANVERVTVDGELRLQDGDLLVLYTDGVTEAMNAGGEQFGIERFCKIIEEEAEAPCETVVGRVMSSLRAWTKAQVDDISIVVLRYKSDSSGGA